MLKIVPVEAPAPTVKILRETFRATSEPRQLCHGRDTVTDGVITVEYADAVIEARASLWSTGALFVYGFVGKYQTGKKIWRVRISQLAPSEKPYMSFGNADRNSGRRKYGSVWYAPKLWPGACE